MRLVTFEVQAVVGRFQRVGVWQSDDRVIDANAVVADYFLRSRQYEDAYREANHFAPPDMLTFIAGGERTLRMVRDAIADVAPSAESRGRRGERLLFHLQDDQIRLRSPLPRPHRIHDFMVVEEHVKNTMKSVPAEWYNMPVCYKGNPDTVIGPDDEVRWPRYTQYLDYELELCAIISRKGKDIPVTDARSYMYGYSIFNDFSARDVQLREMTVGLGPFKGKDFATAIGPCIVTADEFDPLKAKMTVRINGEEWSQGSMGQMHFSFEEIIAYLSNEEEIFPGDVLGSGTVGRGCGMELDRWIQVGDLVEAEVEGIGVLANRVVAQRDLSL